MRIIRLQAENVKKIKAVDITPDSDVVLVTGRNAAGKTSVLDAIWLALQNAEGAKINEKPIREGEKKAQVILDLGDLVVTRRWTEKASYLAVQNKEGAEYKSPQSILDKLMGRLTFDPLAFARMKPREQRASLIDALGISLDDLEEKRKNLYDTRTEHNRNAKQAKAELQSIDFPDDTPEEEISLSEITDRMKELQRERDEVRGAFQMLEMMKEQRAETDKKIEELEKELDDYKTERKAADTQLEYQENLCKSLKEPDLETITRRMENIEAVNRNVRERQKCRELQRKVAAEETTSERYTEELEQVEKEKAERIQKANIPCEGLTIDEDALYFQGVPLTQCSASEQLKVSLAMAMAMNPQLRVIRITDGSLLDSKSMEIISRMAAKEDYQVWIERVDETGKVGVYIEDGEVK